MYCLNCGKKIEEESKFCNHCGASVYTMEDEEVRSKTISSISDGSGREKKDNIKKSNRVRNILLFLMSIFMIALIWIVAENANEKKELLKPELRAELMDEIEQENYTIASDLYDSYSKIYGRDDEILNKLIILGEKTINQQNADYEAANASVSPEDIKISDIEYSGDKVKFKIRNASEITASYIKFDIFISDVSKKIIDTEWTNWSGSLIGGASAQVETYLNDVENAHYISIIVDEVSKK